MTDANLFFIDQEGKGLSAPHKGTPMYSQDIYLREFIKNVLKNKKKSNEEKINLIYSKSFTFCNILY